VVQIRRESEGFSRSQVSSLIREWTSEARVPQRQISAEEIVDRCVYTLVNEGARILEEGIALRAVDIDIIYLNGYGFPAYRGALCGTPTRSV